MENLFVLFDIDDTLAICSPQWTKDTEVYMAAHGFKRIKPAEEDLYDLALSFDMDEDSRELYYRDMFNSFLFNSLLPVPGSKECITKLQKKNCRIEFITGRRTQQYSVTAEWIGRIFNVANPIIHYKAFIDDLHPDILIDNSVRRIRDAQSKGVYAILFTGIDIERNEITDISDLVQAKDFAEISELIDKEMDKNG